MKYVFCRKKIVCFAIAAVFMPVLWIFGFSAKVNAGYVQNPDRDTIGMGEEVTIQLSGDGLEDVYGYEVTIVYPPDEFTFVRSGSLQENGVEACNVEDGVIHYLYTRVGENAEGLPAEEVWSEFVFKAAKEGEASIEVSLRTMDVDYGLQEQTAASFAYKVEDGNTGESPRPSENLEPSENPAISESPKPVESPRPSENPKPTGSPRPGGSPEPNESPMPGERPGASVGPNGGADANGGAETEDGRSQSKNDGSVKSPQTYDNHVKEDAQTENFVRIVAIIVMIGMASVILFGVAKRFKRKSRDDK